MLDLSTLNAPQREAVIAPEGPLLVLAGAGSGKTRVITHRVAWLIERGAAPASILAVTFTNKAADEMRERVVKLVGGGGRGVFVSTFHALGRWLLEKEHAAAELPRRFAICDAADQLTLVKRCLREVNVEGRSFDVRRVVALLSKAKSSLRSSVPVRPQGQGDDYDLVASEVFPRYQAALRAQRSVDFDDLISMPVALLRGHPWLREAYQQRFRHLLVDEYQDTNPSQLELLRLLAGERRDVCAVGDDDQAIYGWRGADVRNVLRFDRHFPGAREIRLEQNYRSTGHILACANAVIGANPRRKAKRLWTSAGSGEPVQVAVLPGEEEEARHVADELVRARAGGRPWSDFAVLYRLNGQARAVEQALREASVPYHVRAGQSFFERAEVRDLLAYLKVCARPEDDVSVSRVLNVPPRGIGDASLERAQSWAAEQRTSLFAALEHASEIDGLPRGAAERMGGFVDLARRHRAAFRAGPIAEVARRLVLEVDLHGHARASVKSAEAAQRKMAALDDTLRSIETWAERTRREATLGNYLGMLALDSREEEPEAGEGVALMTLHAAKGLEFPVVFLVGAEEDLLPCAGIQGEARDLEEERRLAYVGITRARERLVVTRAAARIKRGKVLVRTPSRFLDAFPAESFVLRDPAREPGAPEEVARRSAEVMSALRARFGAAKA